MEADHSSRAAYVVLDGDKIGDHLATAYLSNDEQMLRHFDVLIRQRLSAAEQYLLAQGFVMVACGADGITCKGDFPPSPECFYELSNIVRPYTFSMGSGDSLRDAFISLRFAKAAGRSSYARMEEHGRLVVVAAALPQRTR